MNGYTTSDEVICEISPLLSYDGEGLRGLVAGKQLTSPLLLYSDNEVPNNKPVKTVAMNGSVKHREASIENGIH